MCRCNPSMNCCWIKLYIFTLLCFLLANKVWFFWSDFFRNMFNVIPPKNLKLKSNNVSVALKRKLKKHFCNEFPETWTTLPRFYSSGTNCVFNVKTKGLLSYSLSFQGKISQFVSKLQNESKPVVHRFLWKIFLVCFICSFL